MLGGFQHEWCGAREKRIPPPLSNEASRFRSFVLAAARWSKRATAPFQSRTIDCVEIDSALNICCLVLYVWTVSLSRGF